MIILTGASGGIGKEIVNYLLEIDDVIGLYNKTEPDVSSNKRCIYKQLDLDNSDHIKAFIKQNEAHFKKITLVNLATLKIDGLVANYSEFDWDRMISVNLKGSFLLVQGLLPYMINEQWGRIINISSLGGTQGEAGTAAYSTVKTGIIGFSRVLAKEYARFNITSNVLMLGYFKTGLFNELKDDLKKELINKVPSKMLGDVSNIANAIEFLIRSKYVNGATINIDGGAD